ncbi:MAG TPA: cytochrome c oxidase assembly protein [Patescibacteria group bacterium]|nr:cytochrome c oxidase assembly protein [Patescibacteria group bacterium]
MPRPRIVVLVGLSTLAGLVLPAGAAAHGPVPADPPTLASLALDWHFEPAVGLPLLLAALGWLALVRQVNRVHPETPVPVVRTAAFLGGLAAIAVALMSGIERYDTTLFSVHMVQHLLLLLLAPPLVALAAPITQLLRASSPGIRSRLLLPVLHSTPVSVLANPVVSWLTFGLVLWASHFSPLFNIALENPGAHDLEHAAYLVAGLMFWWPVVGLDPAQRRMGYAARVLYLLLQLPINSFLGMAILFTDDPLYPHYATLGSPYGITALADQQLAGGLMWLAGDIVFIGALLGVVAAWMRHDQRDAPAAERRADVERARLSERADQLARTRATAAGAVAGGGVGGAGGAGGVGGVGGANQVGSGDSSSSR